MSQQEIEFAINTVINWLIVRIGAWCYYCTVYFNELSRKCCMHSPEGAEEGEDKFF
jgi:cytochrome c oxidase assembly factor CtaG